MYCAVNRVHFLRARAQKERWTEELLLVRHEMDWTVRYFQHQAEMWKARAIASAAAGPAAYALRKAAMWDEMVWFTEARFKRTNTAYKSNKYPQ